MLLNLREYYRPVTTGGSQPPLDLALDLLVRPSTRTVPLAGGSQLLASDDASIEAVVDLQALGLDGIRFEAGELIIGCMVTRARLAQDEAIRGVCSGILAQGAHGWGGSVQRNRATLGGAVAVAAGDDPLVAALLACDAAVLLYGRDGYRRELLADFLPRRRETLAAPTLIVEIAIPEAALGRNGALVSVARTPSDAPIVLACAVLTVEGRRCTHARLALGGVAATPARLTGAEQMLVGQELTKDLLARAATDASAAIAPGGDYRGSAEYRRAMVEVLMGRALAQALDRARQMERTHGD